jgi:hypothetical protein
MDGIPSLPHADAEWHLQLNCVCPHCDKWVDLLEDEGFWHSEVEVCEHGTARSRKVLVKCPSCRKDFTVECHY